MFESVRKQSLSEVVFDQLRDRIVGQQLKAGDELPSERVLCELLQVNRGAVREAIKRLQQAGLVKVRHGGATQVLDYRREAGLELLPHLLVDEHGTLQADTARSIVRMRQILTPNIAREAANHHSPETLAQIQHCLAGLRREHDTKRLQYLVFDFWEALVDASGNIVYRLSLNTLRKTYEPLWELFTQLLSDDFHDLPFFEELTAAIAAGDADTAFNLTQTHIDHSSELIFHVIDQYEATP